LTLGERNLTLIVLLADLECMKINVHSLNNGVHIFEFDLDSSELDLEKQNFSITEIALKCTVNKGEKNVYITSKARTRVRFVCDSCLVDFADVLEDEFSIFYTSDKETVRYDDEQVVRLLKPGTPIDLTYGLKENLLLTIPMKIVCSDDCKGLCLTCGINLNEAKCNCKKTAVDPRWAGLEKLRNESPGVNCVK